MCAYMRGGLLVKIRRELRDAESKAKGAKGGERSREQRLVLCLGMLL